MLKFVDKAVYNTIESGGQRHVRPGVENYDLSVGGVGYSTSGGFIDDYVPTIEGWRR